MMRMSAALLAVFLFGCAGLRSQAPQEIAASAPVALSAPSQQGAGNVSATAQGNKGFDLSGNSGNTGLSYISGFGLGAVCVVLAAILTAWMAIRHVRQASQFAISGVLDLTTETSRWSHERAMARLAAHKGAANAEST